jgi:hypothetical protein
MHMRPLLFIAALWVALAHVMVAQDKESAVRVPSDAPPREQADNSKGEGAPKDKQARPLPPGQAPIVPKIIDAVQAVDAETTKEDSSDEIQRRDVNAQESMARAAWAMFWSAIAQITIGGISIYLIFLTLRETRRTLAESEKATKAAQDAANSSAEGVVVTRHIGDSQLRPWLSVSCESTKGFKPSKPGNPDYVGYWLQAVFASKNYGASPASQISLHAEIAAFLPDDDQQAMMHAFCDRHATESEKTGQTVFPGDQVTFNQPLFLSQAMIDEKSRGGEFRTLLTVVYGCICYTSPHTKGVRQTRFMFPVCQLRGDSLSAFRPDEDRWFEKGVVVTSPVVMATT